GTCLGGGASIGDKKPLECGVTFTYRRPMRKILSTSAIVIGSFLLSTFSALAGSPADLLFGTSPSSIPASDKAAIAKLTGLTVSTDGKTLLDGLAPATSQ